LLPAYYVIPHVGSGFMPIAFTVVVLGGTGTVVDALVVAWSSAQSSIRLFFTDPGFYRVIDDRFRNGFSINLVTGEKLWNCLIKLHANCGRM
jgi:branched-subunit amino acid ABC-type transport system permease component